MKRWLVAPLGASPQGGNGNAFNLKILAVGRISDHGTKSNYGPAHGTASAHVDVRSTDT